MRCWTFPYESADGPANMALDEALLDAVAADPAAALLRTYGWTEPTLSLGYFQSVAEVDAEPRWRGMPLVRRPTGGGAIWHHHELTYALVLPAARSLARPSAALYQAVHGALAGLLRGQGVAVAPRGAVAASTTPRRPFLCFADSAAEDLVAYGAKVVGSAQRRRAGAILQHGSLLLRRSPTVPELPGLCDLAPASPDPRYWSSLVAAAIAEALELAAAPQDVPPPLQQRGRELERLLYRNHAWNRRR